jgi:hypothetical protein
MEELTTILPPKYAAYGAALVVLIQVCGRAYHSLASGSGLIGAWRALLYGTTKTPQETKDAAKPTAP